MMNAVVIALFLASSCAAQLVGANIQDQQLQSRILLGGDNVDQLLTSVVNGDDRQQQGENNKQCNENKQQTVVLGGPEAPTGELKYNFNADFASKINPKNCSSDWKWLSVSSPQDGKYVANSGALLRDGISSAELVSVPYGKYVSLDQGRVGLLSGLEAVLVNKHKIQVNKGKKLSVRAAFKVQITNVENQPFGKDAVSNATDDPSLASAGITLSTEQKHGVCVSVVATNNGIWAVYERNRVQLVKNPQSDDKLFVVFHKLADRHSCDEVIDAGIVYDSNKNEIDIKLNNVVVHKIKHLGTLPANDASMLAHTAGRSDLVEIQPTEFVVELGLVSFLDAQDPNNQAHSTRTQRLTNDANVYDEKAKFSDETGNKSLNLWGQGASLTIYDVKIQLVNDKKTENNNENTNDNNNNNDINQQQRTNNKQKKNKEQDDTDLTVKLLPKTQNNQQQQQEQNQEDQEDQDEQQQQQSIGGRSNKRNPRVLKNKGKICDKVTGVCKKINRSAADTDESQQQN